MANKDNLIPQAHTLTVEEQSKGGKASVIARREKKTFQKLAEAALSATVQDEDLKEFARKYGADEKELDVKMLTVLGMVASAVKGNHNAFDRLLELSGDNNEASDDETKKQENLLKAIKKAVKGGN